MKKALDYFWEFISYIVGITVFLILFSVVVQILFRWIPSGSLIWLEEISRLAFPWCIFMGAPLLLRKRLHIKLTIFRDKLQNKKIKSFIVIFIYLTIIFLVGIYTIYGFMQTINGALAYIPILKISMAYLYITIPVHGLLMIFVCIELIVKEFKNIKISN